MKSLINNSIIISTFFLATSLYAADVNTSGQAVTLCKNHAETAHNNYARSKTSKIKETRTGYKITLRVYLADESISSSCEIARDGTLVYTVAE